MHLTKILVLLVLPLTAYAAAQPRSVHVDYHARRSELKREMIAKSRYPDLFPVKRAQQSGDPDPCNSPPGKRDIGTVEQVLTPQEAALYLLGQGSFITDNGTAYNDPYYSIEQKTGAHHVAHSTSYKSRFYKKVMNKLGDLLVEVTLPVYKQWKKGQDPEGLFYLTPATAIRPKDVKELLDELLANKDFDEFTYRSVRVNRRWVEAARSLDG